MHEENLTIKLTKTYIQTSIVIVTGRDKMRRSQHRDLNFGKVDVESARKQLLIVELQKLEKRLDDE